jgi:response regulator RpfG family c-di-GMP phosphodiesterase
VQKGDYASITFTADQMKELRYAALLHDFGKVGVREHVLTKANKLYPDELEMIKARFNIIKLKFEVSALTEKVKRLTLGDNDKKALLQIDESLAAKVAETNDLLGFIEACNLPTVLEEGRFERLSEIGQLLFQDADGSKPYLEANEVLALSTPRGSLTDLERIEIESHVTHTYNFLSAIPWPKSLRHIPMIAYGHHETLNGSGYPRKISTHAIPIQTRIMTICDIFDALTASDRPYKKAVPLQNALDILNDEGKRGRVDAGLLDIFISAKIYQKIRLP